jgi:hypothetical protein
MSLSDCDPAPDGDFWLRIATQNGHIVRGRVHHSAFGGKAISPPAPAKGRPWTRELSGRLRSHAGSLENIEHHAIAFCEAETARGGGTKTFSGVIYARVADAKKAYETILTTGIHFTPLSTADCARRPHFLRLACERIEGGKGTFSALALRETARASLPRSTSTTP